MTFDVDDLPVSVAAAFRELSNKIAFESVNNKGGNGHVFIGYNKLIDRRVVVKFYFWGDGAHAEPRLLSELASPHVLKVEDAAVVDKDYAYFITPFCEGGDLEGFMEAAASGVHQAIDIILNIASGASFIHGKGFLHRDLKPSNIFRNKEGMFLIGDFGSVAKKSANGYVSSLSKHSLFHRTPEEIRNGMACEQSDIYQIGVIFYQILGGSLPYDEVSWLNEAQKLQFSNLSPRDGYLYACDVIQKKICSGRYLDFGTLPAWCPRELISVIRKCCKPVYSERFENIAALIAKINNIRSLISDWRLESCPVLYCRNGSQIRIINQSVGYALEKKVRGGEAWRKIHAHQPTTLKQAVEIAQSL